MNWIMPRRLLPSKVQVQRKLHCFSVKISWFLNLVLWLSLLCKLSSHLFLSLFSFSLKYVELKLLRLATEYSILFCPKHKKQITRKKLIISKMSSSKIKRVNEGVSKTKHFFLEFLGFFLRIRLIIEEINLTN